MPRIRTLKPEHRQHRKVGKLSHIAYRLWIGMILEADDEGRLICDAEQLRVVVFGYHPKVSVQTTEAAIQELAESGLVRTYTSEHVRYADLPSWKDHQRIDHPTKSVLPSPSEEDRPYKKIRVPDAVRREVAFRYGAVEGTPLYVKCHYCREAEGGIHIFSQTGWVAFAELELDHVMPEYLGGPSTADNIVLACRKCNRSKGSRILASETISLAIIPGGSEGIGREGNGMDRNGGAPASAPPPEHEHANGSVRFNIPESVTRALERATRLGAVTALRDPAWWKAAIRANPGVDMAKQVLKAEAYLQAHPEKRYKKLGAFLHGWIGRAEPEEVA